MCNHGLCWVSQETINYVNHEKCNVIRVETKKDKQISCRKKREILSGNASMAKSAEEEALISIFPYEPGIPFLGSRQTVQNQIRCHIPSNQGLHCLL